ncbi:MAG: PRC and DUF2382 domain-containing protein [Actinomycetota bacterium]|nr:PRC and DUF2382 domain-containing protein [Actinomycetota bacterium]
MDTQQVLAMRGGSINDRSGQRIGTVQEIYLDRETDRPEWALVNMGLFGGGASFVPLAGASVQGDVLLVDHDKETVRDAPVMEAGQELLPEEEAELYRHYSLDYAEPTVDLDSADRDVVTPQRGPAEDDASGPMTRSEEELSVGTERREAGRARLRKYVETEQVTRQVPVRREQVRLEREPITESDPDAAAEGAVISEEEHEVTLTEERPVVEKRAVAKERVRLEKEQVTQDVTVSEDLRRERVDLDDPEPAADHDTATTGEHSPGRP